MGGRAISSAAAHALAGPAFEQLAFMAQLGLIPVLAKA
jgi:hypothetical protein